MDGPEGTARQCLPLPQYDVIERMFAFSTCWRYSCLPLAFRSPNPTTIKPYRIRIPNISQYNIDRMPGGVGTITMLKPFAVNMSIAFNPANTSQPVMGPYTSGGINMSLPTSMRSMDVVIEVPGFPWLDSNSGAITIVPGPGATPPAIVAIVPNTTATPRPAASTVVSAQVFVMREVRSASDLASLLSLAAADIQANIAGYVNTLPVAFSDFSVVPDCSSTSRFQFTADVAASLGIPAERITVRCRMGQSMDTGSRRRGRSLTQSSICGSEAVRMTLEISYDQASFTTTNAITAERQAGLQASYGSAICGFGTSTTATTITLTKPKAAGADLASQCQDLITALSIGASELAPQVCTEVVTVDSDDEEDKNSSGLIGGLVGGLGGGLLVAAAAGVVIKMRRDAARTRTYYDEFKEGDRKAAAEERKHLKPSAGGGNDHIPAAYDNGALASAAAARRGLTPGGAPAGSGEAAAHGGVLTPGLAAAARSSRPSSGNGANRVSPAHSSGGLESPRRHTGASVVAPLPSGAPLHTHRSRLGDAATDTAAVPAQVS
jgi:hypothetical protein